MCFFPIRFPSYGILHYMGNAWCFVSISHSIGRSSKIHPVVKIVIKIPIFFPKHGYFSSIIFPPYGILQHVKNAWVFPSVSHSMGKCSKIRPMVWSCSLEPLLHQIPIIWAVHGFSNEFLVLWLNSANHTYYMVTTWNITED